VQELYKKTTGDHNLTKRQSDKKLTKVDKKAIRQKPISHHSESNRAKHALDAPDLAGMEKRLTDKKYKKVYQTYKKGYQAKS